MKVILVELLQQKDRNRNVAASFLKAMAYKKGLLNGHISIEILDGDILSPGLNNAANEIISRKPDIVGFSLYSWNLMPSLSKFSLERDFFPRMVGGDFFGCPSSGFFIDIGTPQRYFKARKYFKKN